MSESPLQIICPHCQALNRVPASRLGDEPRCGKCKQALLTGAPIDVSGAELERWVQKSSLPLVLDCWAPWCGPCRQFAPAYAQVAAALREQVVFLKLNTEQEQAAAGRLGIRSIPSLLIFQYGQEKDRLAGALPASQFQQWVSQHL